MTRGTPLRPLVVAALLSISMPVAALPAYSTVSVSVGTGGLDLASPKGRAALERRIDAAIRDMCGQPVFATRDEAEAIAACRAEARAATAPQLGKALAVADARGVPR